jgi:DNA repair exonuclease SbcCD ATPase subunit
MLIIISYNICPPPSKINPAKRIKALEKRLREIERERDEALEDIWRMQELLDDKDTKIKNLGQKLREKKKKEKKKPHAKQTLQQPLLDLDMLSKYNTSIGALLGSSSGNNNSSSSSSSSNSGYSFDELERMQRLFQKGA